MNYIRKLMYYCTGIANSKQYNPYFELLRFGN